MGYTRVAVVLLAGALACVGCKEPAPSADTEASVAPAKAKPSSSSTAATPPVDEINAKKRCEEGVGALVSSLGGPLQIDLYATRSFPEVAASADAVAGVLARFEKLSKGKLKHRHVDTTTDEAAKQAAKDAGLQEVAFGNSDGATATIGQGYFGLVFTYGIEKEVIPVLSPDTGRGVEFWIANKVRELRDKADGTAARLGVVVGKDEIALTESNLVPLQGGRAGPSMQSIVEQALPFYKFEPVDLTGPIDPDLKGLLITQPGKDFTDEELKRIDEYVMRGRSLAVLASAVNMPAWDPKMQGTLSPHRLDELLGRYGVEMRPEILRDPKHSMSVPAANAAGGTEEITAPGLLVIQHDDGAGVANQPLDNEFAGFFRLDQVAFPYTSPLVLHADRQPRARLRVVARTSSDAVASSTSPIDLMMGQVEPPSGAKAQNAVAVVVDGELKSAYESGSTNDARVLVISSAQFLANPFARAGNPKPSPPQMAMMGAFGGDKQLQAVAMHYARSHLTTTILAFKNVLDWATSDERLIACSALLLDTDAKAPPPAVDKKCTKDELAKLVGSGLTVDEALEVCSKKKK